MIVLLPWRRQNYCSSRTSPSVSQLLNHPNVEVIALLVDERPEEATDFRRNVPCERWPVPTTTRPTSTWALPCWPSSRKPSRLAEACKDVLVLLTC